MVVMGVQRLHLRDGTARIRSNASYISEQPVGRCSKVRTSRRRRYHHLRPPYPAAQRSLIPLHTYTMAMRLAVGRPLGAVTRASSCSRTSMRSFTSTALRAKEVAGQSSETPNMRVRRAVSIRRRHRPNHMRSMHHATTRASSKPQS